MAGKVLLIFFILFVLSIYYSINEKGDTIFYTIDEIKPIVSITRFIFNNKKWELVWSRKLERFAIRTTLEF